MPGRHRASRPFPVRLCACAGLLALFLAVLLPPPASAHRSAAGRTDGLPIPTLTHGQMAVIAENRPEILALADRQPFPDMTFWRLRNYVGLQYAACLWGLVPGSIADEASPFNECSHAYLSGVRALLLHMKTMPGDTAAAAALVDRINMEMLQKNASLVVCRFSEEPFNTAEIVGPHWSEIPFHGPSLLAMLGLAAAFAGGLAMFSRFLRGPRAEAAVAAG